MNDEQTLYIAKDGSSVTLGELKRKLRNVVGNDCELLFVQTDIMFGMPDRSLKRKELLGALSDALLSLPVKTLALATFSYSFANHQPYDVQNSKTSMGALLEYMRKLPCAVYRTEDPLLSITLLGKDVEALHHLSHRSLGEGSAFDVLHSMKGVKFLMFGGEFGESFTYVHHVESMLDVPYRYYQPFTGEIITKDGSTRTETWEIHTACLGILPRCFPELEEELVSKGMMKREPVADGKIVCVSEPDAYREIAEKIANVPCYFLEKPYTAADLVHSYKYGKNGEPVTHC